MAKRQISGAETRMKGKVIAEQPLPARFVLTGSTGRVADRLSANIAEFKRDLPRRSHREEERRQSSG